MWPALAWRVSSSSKSVSIQPRPDATTASAPNGATRSGFRTQTSLPVVAAFGMVASIPTLAAQCISSVRSLASALQSRLLSHLPPHQHRRHHCLHPRRRLTHHLRRRLHHRIHQLHHRLQSSHLSCALRCATVASCLRSFLTFLLALLRALSARQRQSHPHRRPHPQRCRLHLRLRRHRHHPPLRRSSSMPASITRIYSAHSAGSARRLISRCKLSSAATPLPTPRRIRRPPTRTIVRSTRSSHRSHLRAVRSVQLPKATPWPLPASARRGRNPRASR